MPGTVGIDVGGTSTDLYIADEDGRARVGRRRGQHVAAHPYPIRFRRTAGERDYGVVIAAAEPVGEHTRFTLDPVASERRRADLRQRRLSASTTAGGERP